MVKIQALIPDRLFQEARRITVENEMSLAEVVRRGLEWSLTGSALKLQIKLFSKEVIISNPPKRLSLNYKNWKYIQKIF